MSLYDIYFYFWLDSILKIKKYLPHYTNLKLYACGNLTFVSFEALASIDFERNITFQWPNTRMDWHIPTCTHICEFSILKRQKIILLLLLLLSLLSLLSLPSPSTPPLLLIIYTRWHRIYIYIRPLSPFDFWFWL